MGYQSEAQLERQLIADLGKNGYGRVTIKNEQDLIDNLRKRIDQHNREKLGGISLTDGEFRAIMLHLEGKSIFESAKILRDQYVLTRDTGEKVYLEFFDSRQWCKNIFQITSQVTVVGKYENRYDVTLLVNGLPLVQIELKRRGKEMKEAFRQIERYRRHTYRGLWRYIQMFVVSNGVDTKYFANTDQELNYNYAFFWSDEKNDSITALGDFTRTFLEKCQMSKIIARYMVINKSDRSLMVMRPYQIYAVEALVHRALETKNNGYVWHTTGSGKTLTSFKASQILMGEPGIKKVFFLVDRKDLDSQTIDEFNKFSPGSVDTTDRTDTLVHQIADPNINLLVTTIQKMANAVKSPAHLKIMDTLKDERVVFIIDECHRSQFGQMHTDINRHFNNAQYFGFTGTPRLPENCTNDSRTTVDIFEKCLHTYLIKDAIRDGNVLGFSVEYIKTFDEDIDESDDTLVRDIDREAVFMADKRIKMVAQNIIDIHPLKSRNGNYSSIFATQSIPMLIKYYSTFKSFDHNLKIAAIFTYGANENMDGKAEHSRDSLERIIDDYNQMFDTNYSTDSYAGYFQDVSKKLKQGKIDILIVVEMFLTGFDSKILNTLYVDKWLKTHGLLQAFSRTNRVEKNTKPFGNIVCYRRLKSRTDESIKLFSQTDSIDTVIGQTYDEYLAYFKQVLEALLGIVSTPDAVDKLEAEEDQEQFIRMFRELTITLDCMRNFVEFNFDHSTLGISEQAYQDFKSKYLDIYERIKSKRLENDKASILDDIDFCIELMHTDKINVSYILNLIREIDLTDGARRKKDISDIEKLLETTDNEELRRKVDLIRAFLAQVVPTLDEGDSAGDAYDEFEEQQREKEIVEFATGIEVDPSFLRDEIAEYEYAGTVNRTAISDTIQKGLLEKRFITERIIEFIKDNALKYQA